MEAVSLRADCTKIEDELNAGRNRMALANRDVKGLQELHVPWAKRINLTNHTIVSQ